MIPFFRAMRPEGPESISFMWRFLSLTGIVLLCAGLSAEAMTLIQDGSAKASIVVPERPHPKIKQAAEELQRYLEKISGAKMPIVTEDQAPKEGPLVVVGAGRLTQEMKIDVPSGLTHARREEGFVLVCRGNRLVLAGNNDGPYHGTEYAVYEFLNRLGVRWFMPGDFGEIVPQTKTIEFDDVTLEERPDFILRNWNHDSPLEGRENIWKIRNKMNPVNLFEAPQEGSAAAWMPKDTASKNPEWLATRRSGSRNNRYPNLTNPRTREVFVQYALEYFRRNPAANSLAFAPGPSMSRDWSAPNEGFLSPLGRRGFAEEISVTEEWIAFASDVTRQVRQQHPDIYLCTSGYGNRDRPPQGVEIDDHLVIMYAPIWSCNLHAYDTESCWHGQRAYQSIRQWLERTPNVAIVNYNYRMITTGLTPLPEIERLRRNIPLLKELGVMGFVDETRCAWAESGIASRYLWARLEWDADLDVDALLADFYEQWYGPARDGARAFWDALDAAGYNAPVHIHDDRMILRTLYTDELMQTLDEELKKAEAAIQNDPRQPHVQADRLIYEHLQRYLNARDAEAQADYHKAAEQYEAMFDLRQRLHEINEFFIWPEKHNVSASGVWYNSIAQRIERARQLAKKMDGSDGDLVVRLPAECQYRPDPRGDGLYEEWYRPDSPAAGWAPIESTRPFYLHGEQDKQGYPYMGVIWYKFSVQIPEGAPQRPAKLYADHVETEAWVWVNGQYIGHRPYQEAWMTTCQVEFDLGAVQPGETIDVTIRVDTGDNAAQQAAGLQSRPFIWAPK